MALWLQIGLAVVLGPVLWLAGAIFFDFVHLVLHAMLRSPWRILRALAWPHAVHHQWIDRDLRVRWEKQGPNIACHLVPEYLTQLGFTAGVALLLPLPFAAVLALLQTLTFGLILRDRGLDINHRPIEILDAYRPGFMTPPAYHALHHVYPDAFYAAYGKLVDFLARSAAQLRGRRFAILGTGSGFGAGIEAELRRRGVVDIARLATLDGAVLEDVDVLLLCDPSCDEATALETFIDATRTRQLPPEAWVVHARADDPIAGRYLGDVRIQYRTLIAADWESVSAERGQRLARRAVSRIQRGLHCVPTAAFLDALRDWKQFRAAVQRTSEPRARARHRLELANAKGGGA